MREFCRCEEKQCRRLPAERQVGLFAAGNGRRVPRGVVMFAFGVTRSEDCGRRISLPWVTTRRQAGWAVACRHQLQGQLHGLGAGEGDRPPGGSLPDRSSSMRRGGCGKLGKNDAGGCIRNTRCRRKDRPPAEATAVQGASAGPKNFPAAGGPSLAREAGQLWRQESCGAGQAVRSVPLFPLSRRQPGEQGFARQLLPRSRTR